jgi:hypothetical protein
MDEAGEGSEPFYLKDSAGRVPTHLETMLRERRRGGARKLGPWLEPRK